MAGASRRTVRKKLPCRARHRKSPRLDPLPADPPIPRISRLMALAVVFEEMLQRGEVKDYAELARIGQVSRARISQIMDLLNLAPEIQEALLELQDGDGADPVTERQFRGIAATTEWTEQCQSDMASAWASGHRGDAL